MTDKRGQLRTRALSFGLQTDHNLAETVISTFPAQQNWFSIAPWFFQISLVNDSVDFGLVNCYNLQILNLELGFYHTKWINLGELHVKSNKLDKQPICYNKHFLHPLMASQMKRG
jgi:hypothetical protein